MSNVAKEIRVRLSVRTVETDRGALYCTAIFIGIGGDVHFR